MPSQPNNRVYFLEARQRTHDGTGRWGAWYLMDNWFNDYRAARRERDRLNDGDRTWECRLVTFKRERTFKKGSTDDAVL
jgi:hypothetical protein